MSHPHTYFTRTQVGLFDVVVVNLSLERALNARAWLVRFIGDIIAPGGRIVIAVTEALMPLVTEVLGSRSLRLISRSAISPAPCDGPAVVTVWGA